jgi:metallo-beta-lactamase class B
MGVLRAAVAFGVGLAFGAGAVLLAQETKGDAPPPLPPDLAGFAEGLTTERPIPPALVASLQSWVEQTEPVKIVGPIYFVGTKGLGAYLITTAQGHILLDGGMPQSARAFEASIREAGFRPEDIKILLITHAHIDHAGVVAHFKRLSNAEVAVMDREAELLASGGRTDFRYGDLTAFHFPGTTTDRQVKDGESVTLGNVKMTARLSAGHTKGTTTWITEVEDERKSYKVVFPGSVSINAGYRLVVDPSYPGIADDYARTLSMLESLKPDIWLPAHPEVLGFEARRARALKEGVAAWVDPEGYASWVAKSKAAYEQLLAKEKLLGPAHAASGLEGTSWKLVRFQGGDEAVLTPDDPSKYTFEFRAEGKLSARIDCNRGTATWTSEGPDRLELGPLELTRMACPLSPFGERLLKGLDLRAVVRSERRPAVRFADGRRRHLRARAFRKPSALDISKRRDFRSLPGCISRSNRKGGSI